jgi:hypothetical protein
MASAISTRKTLGCTYASFFGANVRSAMIPAIIADACEHSTDNYCWPGITMMPEQSGLRTLPFSTDRGRVDICEC